MSGIPVAVARTYDTLTANREGDFGYGWRLEFRNADLRTSVAETGLEEYGLCGAFRPGSRVYVTLPGGTREGFTFTPRPRGIFDLVLWTPEFAPDPGVTSRLTVASVPLVLAARGEFQTVNGRPYNPAGEEFGGGYTPTARDGTAYRVGGGGKLRDATDRNANRLTFTDAGVTSSSGVAVTFARDARGRITAATGPMGRSVRYAYDAAGSPARVTDREGNMTRFEYRAAPAHYLDRVIDPLGRTGARLEYDANGRLVGTIDANGGRIAVGFDPANSVQTVRDQLGNPTVHEYDARGNVVAVTGALGGVTRYTHDATGNRLTETDPLGRVVRFRYDTVGNVRERTDFDGNMFRFTHNAVSDLLAMVGPTGLAYLYTRDARGNLLTPTSPEGGTTRFGYDAAGNVVTETDPLGHASAVARDANGREVSVTDPLGLTTRYEYDDDGNRTRVVYADGSVSTSAFDARRLVTAETDPDGRTRRTEYDSLGRVIPSSIDP